MLLDPGGSLGETPLGVRQAAGAEVQRGCSTICSCIVLRPGSCRQGGGFPEGGEDCPTEQCPSSSQTRGLRSAWVPGVLSRPLARPALRSVEGPARHVQGRGSAQLSGSACCPELPSSHLPTSAACGWGAAAACGGCDRL